MSTVRLVNRTIWGSPRQYYLTVPRTFAERHRNVVILYGRDFLLVIPVEKLAGKSPCDLLEEVTARVCYDEAREANR